MLLNKFNMNSLLKRKKYEKHEETKQSKKYNALFNEFYVNSRNRKLRKICSDIVEKNFSKNLSFYRIFSVEKKYFIYKNGIIKKS